AIRLERVYSTSGGSAFRQAGIADATGAAVFATPLGPAASQPLQQSPAAMLAAAADGYFQGVGQTGSAQPALLFSDDDLPLAADDELPDALPLAAIDAALADDSLLQGALDSASV